MTNLTNTTLPHFQLSYLADVQILFIAIEIFVGSVTIIGSLTVLALYYRVSSRSCIHSRKYFIALALADLQEGLITSSLAIFVSFGLKVNEPYCLESIALAMHTIFVTLFLMVGMSIDRYLAIIYPLRYKTLVTNTITVCVICVSWCGGILIGFLVYYTGQAESPHPEILCFVYTERTSLTFAVVVIVFVIVPCVCVFLYLYGQMYKVILNAMKSIVSHTDKFKELGKIVIRKNTKSTMEPMLGGIKVKDVRSTLILFITILFFLLTYLPGIVLLVMFEVFPDRISLGGTLAAYVISQMNSMMNPFLYARNIANAGKIVKNWMKMVVCIMETPVPISSISR